MLNPLCGIILQATVREVFSVAYCRQWCIESFLGHHTASICAVSHVLGLTAGICVLNHFCDIILQARMC